MQATISGNRTDLVMGRPVFAAGRLAEIEGPRNPGELDYQMLMRARGIRVRLFISRIRRRLARSRRGDVALALVAREDADVERPAAGGRAESAGRPARLGAVARPAETWSTATSPTPSPAPGRRTCWRFRVCIFRCLRSHLVGSAWSAASAASVRGGSWGWRR